MSGAFNRELILAGHYSHDVLINAGTRTETLGGSVAYAGALLKAFALDFKVVSKVGEDFKYAERVEDPRLRPVVKNGFLTTRFLNDNDQKSRRCEVVCDAIRPADLAESARVGLAVGIAGEVLAQTLLRLRGQSRFVLADAQGLIRKILPDGTVTHAPLRETPYAGVIGAIDFLKASRAELPFIDRASLPASVTLIVTEGDQGATILANPGSAAGDVFVPPFAVQEIDPTGAGDSFLAGLAVGILRGLPLERAVRLGNRCGAMAVTQAGIPDYSHSMVAGGLLEIS